MVELVDRDEEMNLLLRRWQLAQNGAGQVVMLTGEAGIGKSRLAAEVEARIAPGPDACLKYYGLPHQTTASMFAVIDELQRACGFENSDSASKGLSELEAVLITRHLEFSLPYRRVLGATGADQALGASVSRLLQRHEHRVRDKHVLA